MHASPDERPILGRPRRAARVLAVGAVCVVVALGVAACGGDDDTDDGTGGRTGSDGATDAAVVIIDDVAFTTPDVTVTAGGTVTFDNQDAQAHTANGDGGAFDTGTIKAGETSEITFDTAGTFTYFCAFHPFMKGTVTVE
jgi:plastocyanin